MKTKLVIILACILMIGCKKKPDYSTDTPEGVRNILISRNWTTAGFYYIFTDSIFINAEDYYKSEFHRPISLDLHYSVVDDIDGITIEGANINWLILDIEIMGGLYHITYDDGNGIDHLEELNKPYTLKYLGIYKENFYTFSFD